MSIHLSDFLLENLQELNLFIHKDFQKRIYGHPKTEGAIVLDNPYITRISASLFTFDYHWSNENIHPHFYQNTHCFIYPIEKYMQVLGFCNESVGEEHLHYIVDNIESFEQTLKRENIINNVLEWT